MHRAVDRGVSPLLGSALLVVIAVVILSVVAIAVFGGSPGVRDPPPARFDVSYDVETGNLTVTHVSGTPLDGSRVLIEDNDGGSANWSALHPNDSDAVEGTSITFDGKDGAATAAGGADGDLQDVCLQDEGYTYSVVYVERSGDKVTLSTYSLPRRSSC